MKIGSSEKDELLVHLLQQVASYRTQLREVATLGETIAAQLVHQQVQRNEWRIETLNLTLLAHD